MKKLALLALALTAAFALAQTPTVGPERGDGPDAVAKGPDKASVNQTVDLILPQATALHLDVTNIKFDLTAMDGKGWPHATDPFAKDGKIACVYAFGDDVTTQQGDNFWNQAQVLPGGTKYQAQNWPYISIVGNGIVDSYPPIELDPKTGELQKGSKGYFVCYKTFVLQLFSNWKYWDLTVTRQDKADQYPSIEHLYVQGNTCAEFGKPTGLYDLPDQATRHLIPKDLNFGPTGDHIVGKKNLPKECRNKSWLDTLVVLAVKINSDAYGKNRADLTYTLMSADAQFGAQASR